MFVFDVIVFSVLVVAALIFGFVWSILLAAASSERGLGDTLLSVLGLIYIYHWWKQRRHDDTKEPIEIE